MAFHKIRALPYVCVEGIWTCFFLLFSHLLHSQSFSSNSFTVPDVEKFSSLRCSSGSTSQRRCSSARASSVLLRPQQLLLLPASAWFSHVLRMRVITSRSTLLSAVKQVLSVLLIRLLRIPTLRLSLRISIAARTRARSAAPVRV